MTTWDHSFDLVVVGSGGGGLVAALAAADAGITSVVLEKRDVVGGSTAMSGGVIWLPNNPLMQAEGVADSYEAGLAHFEDVVGDVGPASSTERRHAYLTGGSKMVTFLQGKGVQLIRCPGYSDYYDTAKGGNAKGRSIEPKPYDGRKLGEWQSKLQPGLAKGIGLAVKTNELRFLPYYNRSVKALFVSGRVWLRTMLSRLRRQDLLTNGASLMAQILRNALDANVPIWTNTALEELIVEDGRVVGVRVMKDGAVVHIQARKGVLLSAGGFAHNAEMRRKYSGDQPNEGLWTAANPGDTGEVLEAAMQLGVKTDLMDEAWWLPVTGARELAGSTLPLARQRPGAIFVDAAGQRFCNESNSFVEVGKAMYARNKDVSAVPCWLIFDDGYRRRYASGRSLPGRLPKEWIEKGIVKRGATVEELAGQIGVDAEGLAATIKRFNVNAAKGQDPDYGRGESAYNACLGDPHYKPNAALGPLDRAPYYATQIYPSDVGTCGGLITNENAQVIGEDGSPVPGLYAAGNITATVMGRKYLGAGSSIANTMIFGFIAGQHVAAAPN